MPEPMLETFDLVKSFAVRRGFFAQRTDAADGRRPRHYAHQRGRDAGPRGRVRLRQVHPGPDGDAALRADQRASAL